MTASDRAGRVLADLVSLVDTVLDDYDVVDLLSDLAVRCAAALEVVSAGVLLTDPTGELHLMGAASSDPREVTLYETQQHQGPCRDCQDTGEVVTVGDLGTARGRWPEFADAAREAGFVAAHAVPLRAAGRTLGSVGLLGRDTGVLDPDDITVALALAQVATVAVVQATPPTAADVNARLHAALAGRTVVEQARGLVAHHLDVSVDRALELLRARARATDRHLTEIARDLMSDPAGRGKTLDALAALR